MMKPIRLKKPIDRCIPLLLRHLGVSGQMRWQYSNNVAPHAVPKDYFVSRSERARMKMRAIATRGRREI